MSKFPIKILSAPERIQLRMDGVIAAQKFIIEALSEEANKVYDVQPFTPEHERARFVLQQLEEIQQNLSEEYQSACLAKFYYEQGLEDGGTHNDD